MFGDWVPELHLLIVGRPINALIIKKVRQIIIQEIDKPVNVNGCRFWRALLHQAEPHSPLGVVVDMDSFTMTSGVEWGVLVGDFDGALSPGSDVYGGAWPEDLVAELLCGGHCGG